MLWIWSFLWIFGDILIRVAIRLEGYYVEGDYVGILDGYTEGKIC